MIKTSDFFGQPAFFLLITAFTCSDWLDMLETRERRLFILFDKLVNFKTTLK